MGAARGTGLPGSQTPALALDGRRTELTPAGMGASRRSPWGFYDYFWFNQLLLELCGVLPMEARGFPLSLVLIILCFTACSFLVIPGVYTVTTYGDRIDPTEKFNIIGELLEILVGAVKVIALLPYRSKLLSLKLRAARLWKGVKDDEDRREIEPYLRRALFMTYGFFGNVLFALISMVVAPLFARFIYDANGTMVASKSLPYSVGIVHENRMLFNVWWALQAPAGLLGMVPIVGIDTGTSFFVLHACAHLRLLQARFLKIAEERCKDPDKKMKDDHRARTIACINTHQEIISYCQEMEAIFRMIVLIQTINSITAICGFGFNLLAQDKGTVMYAIHLIGATVQLSIFCWPPDSLQNESLSISFVAFNLKWYDWTKRDRFLVEFIIKRSQKPLILTAAKFAIMSMLTFSSILSSAFSFFSILRQTL